MLRYLRCSIVRAFPVISVSILEFLFLSFLCLLTNAKDSLASRFASLLFLSLIFAVQSCLLFDNWLSDSSRRGPRDPPVYVAQTPNTKSFRLAQSAS